MSSSHNIVYVQFFCLKTIGPHFYGHFNVLGRIIDYLIYACFIVVCCCCYPPTKSEGYSFGVVRPSVHSVRSSVSTFCLSGTISQYILVRFDSFLVQKISTMDSRYPISLVKIDPLTLE